MAPASPTHRFDDQHDAALADIRAAVNPPAGMNGRIYPDDDVPRPRLLADHSWSADGAPFKAHLWGRIQGHTVSNSPALTSPPEVPDDWWVNLRTAVNTVGRATPPPGREVMTQSFVHRITRFIPALEGADLTVGAWRTAHGDLHWANLAAELTPTGDSAVEGTADRR